MRIMNSLVVLLICGSCLALAAAGCGKKYTEYDSSAINGSGRYLLDNQMAKVVIEGNCDDRGTDDYYLALGQLRAFNVKKYLVNLGVDETRVTTVSYGFEHPLSLDRDEFSWAINRRADLVMP